MSRLNNGPRSTPRAMPGTLLCDCYVRDDVPDAVPHASTVVRERLRHTVNLPSAASSATSSPAVPSIHVTG